MRALPITGPLPAPRRLRVRLVLGFGLTVAIVLAALTLGERIILSHTMTDTLVQSLTVAARVGTQNPSGFVSGVTINTARQVRPGLILSAGSSAARCPCPQYPETRSLPRILNPRVTAVGGISIATVQGQQTGLLPAGGIPPGMDQMAMASLRQIAETLAGPDQPVGMLDAHGHLLTSQVSLTGDRLRPHAVAGRVLADLLAAARPHMSGLHQPWHATISTADGSYLVVLWPSQLQVVEQVRPHAVRVLMLTAGQGVFVGSPPFSQAHTTTSSIVVLLATKLAATQYTLDMVTVISLGGALLALSLTVVLGLLVVNTALRPLATITGAAEQLARGDYGYRLALGASTDEVGRLATAFNRMAEAIGAAFATQRRFLADASHELRTPLTALRGYTDVLLLKLRVDPDTAERLARAMQEDAVRMSRLVNDLLTLARLEGGLDLQCGPLILQELVMAAATEAAAITGGTQEIMVDPGSAEVIVWGDRDRVRQVLSNIVGNACAYSPAGSHIALRIHNIAGWAQIVVQDDGPGIAAHDLVRLGERFFRGDSARSRQSGGSGLGLAIARGIVAAHGGTLSIQSTVGVGTVVAINFPLAPCFTAAHRHR